MKHCQPHYSVRIARRARHLPRLWKTWLGMKWLNRVGNASKLFEEQESEISEQQGMPKIERTYPGSTIAGAAKRGFTIVQLAVCVAAMMLGLVFFIPAVKHQFGLASSTTCMENLGKIYEALWTYERANGGAWPEQQIHTTAGLIKDSNVWINLITEPRYIKDLGRFTCPGDPNAPQRDTTPAESFRWRVSHAPSYGLNQMTWREYGVAPSDDTGMARDPSHPDRTIMLADLGPDYAESELPEGEGAKRALLERARDSGRLVPDDGFRVGVVNPTASWLVPRHGRSINLIAMDGHVGKTHDVSELVAAVPEIYYDDCAMGNCTFCNHFRALHYDFSGVDLYWWTGPYDRRDFGRDPSNGNGS